MPRYFLHLIERDDLIRDIEGAEFVDLDAARDEAVESIRAIVADHIASGEKLLLRTIEICDDKGNHLATVKAASALRDILPISEDAFEADLSNYGDILRHM
jgi:hypothetical protein